jgi:hypothetical protein
MRRTSMDEFPWWIPMKLEVRRIAAALGLLAVVASCSDSRAVTAPAVSGGSNRLVLNAPTQVQVVTRDTPLSGPVSASRLVGVFGGVINLPEAGLSVTIPAFALTSPTTITVTAVPGSELAYEFEPHGTQFRVPLIVTQQLAGTSASAGGVLPAKLRAAYFADVLDLDQLDGTATVSELFGTSINTWNGTVSFAVWHFSGYLIAAGEDGGTQ